MRQLAKCVKRLRTPSLCLSLSYLFEYTFPGLVVAAEPI
jgi:hypothetical protein